MMVFGDYDIPQHHDFPTRKSEIINQKTGFSVDKPSFLVDGTLVKGKDSLVTHLIVNAEDGSYSLALSTGLNAESAPNFLLENSGLPLNSLGVMYDFEHQPDLKDKVASFAQVRVPKTLIPSDIYHRSFLNGELTSKGLAINQRLFLRNLRDDDFLKCYEIEIFKKNDGELKPREQLQDNRIKNVLETQTLSPESIYQEQEKHYCLIPESTYPMIPIDLQEVTSLWASIHAAETLDQSVCNLIYSIPMPFDATTQWFVELASNHGNIAVLRKPSWGENRVKLVYREKSEGKLPLDALVNGVESLLNLKSALKQ